MLGALCASSADVAARQTGDRVHGIDKNKDTSNKTHRTHRENRTLRRQKRLLLCLIRTGDFKHISSCLRRVTEMNTQKFAAKVPSKNGSGTTGERVVRIIT